MPGQKISFTTLDLDPPDGDVAALVAEVKRLRRNMDLGVLVPKDAYGALLAVHDAAKAIRVRGEGEVNPDDLLRLADALDAAEKARTL